MARRRDDDRARRIELYVYAAAAVTYIVTGFFVRSQVLNWVVGPLWFVVATWLLWRFLGRRLWERAPEEPSPATV
ncbi:MAG: hypothetical protein ACR2JF_04315 [Iamia sp.]